MGDASSRPRHLLPVSAASERLDSWKEIAAYLKRDVSTAQILQTVRTSAKNADLPVYPGRAVIISVSGPACGGHEVTASDPQGRNDMGNGSNTDPGTVKIDPGIGNTDPGTGKTAGGATCTICKDQMGKQVSRVCNQAPDAQPQALYTQPQALDAQSMGLTCKLNGENCVICHDRQGKEVSRVCSPAMEKDKDLECKKQVNAAYPADPDGLPAGYPAGYICTTCRNRQGMPVFWECKSPNQFEGMCQDLGPGAKVPRPRACWYCGDSVSERFSFMCTYTDTPPITNTPPIDKGVTCKTENVDKPAE
jgi:hypothetical protein